MIKSLNRFSSWLRARGPDSSDSPSSPASAPRAAALVRACQTLQRAFPTVEQQLSAARAMEDLLSEVEGYLGQAWQERDKLLGDYYTTLRAGLRVLDDCLSLEQTEPAVAVIRAGVETLLRQQAVEAIDTAEGDSFQPELHEASQTELSEVHPPGTVLRVVQTGYQRRAMDGAIVVLRPATVVVTEGKPRKESAE